MTTAPAHLVEVPGIARAISRLAGITGFVTTVSAPDDPRPRAYNRLDHIRRVDLAASVLASTHGIDTFPDTTREIVWLHDLNRWPFAHHLERDRYDQAGDVRGFLARCGLAASPRTLEGIAALHAWNVGSDDEAAVLALAADKVAGVVEDTLLAVCGLNVRPSRLAPELLSVAGLADDAARADPGELAELAELATLLNRDRAVEEFVFGFHDVFGRAVRRSAALLAERFGRSADGLRTAVREVRVLRDRLVRPTLFPINNEHVCHGSRLDAQVFGPFLDRGDGAAQVDLLSLDDAGLARELAARPPAGAPDLTFGDFVPDLDYVLREAPDLAFVRSAWSVA